MKCAALAAISLFLLVNGIAEAVAPASARIVPGTYRQIDTVTKQVLAVGSQVVIIAGKGGRLGFSVNAVRQADMNQGFVVGLLPAGPPLTWSRAAASGNCRLTFEPLPKALKVTQDAAFGDCGFGYGVTATGTYALVAEKTLKP